MANNAFIATIYGEAKTFDAKNGGWQVGQLYASYQIRSFPVVGTDVIGITPGQSISATVVANAIIEILPSGTNHAPLRFFTDSTVAALNTARI